MKIPNIILNQVLNFEKNRFIPKKLIRRIIKKNKIFFIETDLKNLPNLNYSLEVSIDELIKNIDNIKNENSLPINEYRNLALILKLIFKDEEKFNFLDFGAQYLDNYYYINKFNKNINYYYYDQPHINKVVEEFASKKNFKNFSVLKDINNLSKIKIDFIYFGSVIQYVNNYNEIINKLLELKPKYVFFSGLNTFYGLGVKTIICKQLNIFPKINYCYFFEEEYFKKLIINQGYNLMYISKNPFSEVNYSNLENKLKINCKYTDLIFERK